MKASDNTPGSLGKPATTDEYLRAVTIGARKPHNGPVELVPYDPGWPTQFSLQANRIRSALSGKVILLEHVGSTSVPGLSAKPVIDMVLAVSNSADEPSYVPQLEAQGFVLRIREPDWFDHRLLKAPDIEGNLHVFSGGCDEIERMLTFRDWLRVHEPDRLLYEKTKRELAARTWKDVQNYADAKSEMIQEILMRAQGSTLS
ncbi:MAG: GrpB family protein [Candidatus Eisenbacteria bacterium]